MGLNLQSFDGALKSHYTDDTVLKMVYEDNPALALIPKMENFTGKNLPIVLLYKNPGNRSRDFGTAQSGTSTSGISDFVLTRVKDYGFATIDNETLEASKGNKGAFMEALSTEIDGVIHNLSRNLGISMYGDKSGFVGQVKAEPSTGATTVIEMKQAGAISNFEVDDRIQIFSAKTGGTQRSVDGTIVELTISAIDRSNGTLTIADAYDASGTIAADDYIFKKGDRGVSISGFEGWVPQIAPTTGDNHFGVDRSIDVTRMAGLRHDGSSEPIEEALISGASLAAKNGSKVDHCFISFKKYADLEKALTSRVQYVDLKMEKVDVGFRGILLNGPRGPIKVIPDVNCPDDVAWMLQLSTWKLYSLGKAVRVLNSDGLSMLRQSSADGVEVRYGFYGNIGCRAPGFNCRVKLA